MTRAVIVGAYCITSGSSGVRVGGMAFAGVASNSTAASARRSPTPLGNTAFGRKMVTRWDEWFSDDNLAREKRILSAPPTRSAEKAAGVFVAKEKRFILDLACGVGRDTRYLASCGLDVIGVDASFKGLQVAQQVKWGRGAASALVAADGRRLPFKDRSFEGVYCFGLLHEFTGEGRDGDVMGVMNEIKRLMCDDGVLVLAVLAGEPDAGLPHVQLFTRRMFGNATKDFREIEVQRYGDVGCTGRGDYLVWCGIFKK